MKNIRSIQNKIKNVKSYENVKMEIEKHLSPLEDAGLISYSINDEDETTTIDFNAQAILDIMDNLDDLYMDIPVYEKIISKSKSNGETIKEIATRLAVETRPAVVDFIEITYKIMTFYNLENPSKLENKYVFKTDGAMRERLEKALEEQQ